ncbi:hypothetical protein VTO42DRAFT_7473 [Malbranchea cinnamomea]
MIFLTPKLALRSLLRGGFFLSAAACRCNYSIPPKWNCQKLFSLTAAGRRRFSHQSNLFQTSTSTTEEINYPDWGEKAEQAARVLPISCPGCGALTQWIEPEEAGFYNLHRTAVKKYINRALARTKHATVETRPSSAPSSETESASSAAGPSAPVQQELDDATEGESGTSREAQAVSNEGEQDRKVIDAFAEARPTEGQSSASEGLEYAAPLQPPFCDRCHLIVNHNEARPIPYPPLSYIRDIMDESPYENNHVYHIVDAADFPLSVVSSIYRHLDVQPQRPRNRRSKVKKYGSSQRLADLQFIITRSDLLGPTKEKVDGLMQDMIEILRKALGPIGEKARLGNVHMVSAYNGWWTKKIKKKIWDEGGAVWMVGKTNVGKSNLIETVFPKSQVGSGTDTENVEPALKKKTIEKNDILDPDSLLPPPQKVEGYPVLPIVSASPGTTASPIRIPFGGGRGEVIDLPGLYRTGLGDYVKDERKIDLIMTKRPKPKRLSIKPGQSLLLDRLIRITPLDPDVVVLAAPFVPLYPHVTSTQKALEIEEGKRPYRPILLKEGQESVSIAKDDVGSHMASAGVFDLCWDVTRTYGEKKEESDLPLLYRMLAVDVLIEGSGWVELVCQVRTKNRALDDFPKVEIFSPEGKFVGVRKSLRTYAFIEERNQIRRRKAKKRRRFGS